MTSTSLPRTAGRPRSTRIATSSPARSEAIIPVAAQPKTSRLTRPSAVAGEARFSISRVTSALPVSESGSASMISLITLAAEAVVAEHDPEDRDEHDRERDEREEDAVGDAGGVLAAAVGEEAVDRLRDHADERAEELEGPADEPQRPRGRFVGQPGRPPSGKSRRPSGTAPSVPGTLPAASFPGSSIGRAIRLLTDRVLGSSPSRGACNGLASRTIPAARAVAASFRRHRSKSSDCAPCKS